MLCEPFRYSVPEEKKAGSMVANVLKDLKLVTQQPLDREQMSQYNITITATDQGSPRLTSMTVISIQLSDVNDNPPMFERSFYDLHLRENNIPGLLIGSVHAVDVDTEQNAKLTYWLLPGKIRDIPASSYISINSETGNLYAIRSVDYEDIQDFQVMVRAVDKGSPPLSSETMVRVLIRDENDNAPFVLCPLQNSTSPSKELVPRGAETGYLVTKVVATDRDSGQNSWLSYQLLKATDPSLFAVGTQNGEVKTTRPVNIRDTFKHTLIVAVRDNGHPPQSVSATLRILLVDGFSDPYMKIMDNPKSEVPQEEDHTLTMYLIICLVAISSIFLLSVMVFIATKFQKRRKFIGSSHSASNFPVGPSSQDKCVDPNTGTPSQAFSYEVCLADGSLSSEFKFLRPFFPVFTMEHRKTLLNPQIRNDCRDLPNQLEEREDISQLVLQSPLDRETVTEYNITITAIDCGSPRLTSTRLINVQISDVNDNPPLFEKPSFDMQIRENHIPAVPPFPPASADAPENCEDSQNGSLPRTYRYDVCLTGGSLSSEFRFLRPLFPVLSYPVGDVNVPGNHWTSSGPEDLSKEVTINGRTKEELLHEESYSQREAEKMEVSPPSRQVVLFFISLCSSGMLCEPFRYSVPEEKKAGSMVANVLKDLKLVTQQPLDREQMSQYNITITATDQGSPRLTSMTVISIQLSDVNDNPPMFERSFYDLHLRENNIPGLLIGSVHAVDVDTEQNAKLTYWLLPGKIRDVPASSYISINSETGNLYAIRSVDYEDIQDFQVMVRAVDKGSPPLSSETMVRVLIRDENDNAPFVLCPLQNSTSPSKELVPRGAETGYLVTKVVATDRDSGQNSWLSYQLLKATDPSLFAVGTQNGEVKTMRPVNIRDSFKHTLIVAVRDNGHPPQSVSATLRILLVDGFSDPYMKIMDNPKSEVPQEEDHTLTMYLIICLVAISSIFLLSVMVFIATKFQKRRKFIGSSHSASNFPVGPSSQDKCVDPNTGTPSQAFSYEVCLADGSLSSEFKFLRPFFPVFTMEHRKTLLNPQIRNDCRDLPNQLEEREDISQDLGKRVLNERDTNKQRLVILVRDNGLPPQTSTALLNVLLVDGFSDPFLRRVDVSVQEPEEDKTLTKYLVICLAAVSFVFLVCIVVFVVVKILKKDPQSHFTAAVPHFPPASADVAENCADSQNGSLPRTYRYDVCLTGGSLSSEFRFLRPLFPVLSCPVGDVNVPGNHWTSSGPEDLSKQVAVNGRTKELVLQSPLDRETVTEYNITITAIDCGSPRLTSTRLINVQISDVNDNPPLFEKRVDVSVQEPEEDKTLTKYLVICLAAVSFVFLVCIVVFIVVKILKKDPQSHFSAAVPHFPPASADAPENCADSQNGSLSRTYRYDVCLTGGSLSSEFRFLRPLFPVFSVGDVNVPGNHWTSSGPEDLSKQVVVNGTTKEVRKNMQLI
ncbi:hypothetical protein Chor_003251 [Crotalus horridus]